MDVATSFLLDADKAPLCLRFSHLGIAYQCYHDFLLATLPLDITRLFEQ